MRKNFQNLPVHQPEFGYYAAVDELNRKTLTHKEVPKAREDRYVGIFYFLWLGMHGIDGPYDITKILEEAPDAVYNPNHPLWGPEGHYHHWGEPLYGYYFSTDEWVLRRHVQLLTNAGIDFLVFDTTNSVIYKEVYDRLLPVLEDIQQQGWDVPKIVFYTNTASGETVKTIYDDIYRKERFSDLWFYWKNKPLIIGDPKECSSEIQNFFTFRRNQWPNEEQKVNGFPWIEFKRPQRVYYNDEGEKEIINVSVSQHPTISMSDTPFYDYDGNWGRSYRNKEHDLSSEGPYWGHNIAEQWEFALREDPQIIFITGWNEWIAMRLPGVNSERPILFVDQATLDFSRDIEPMKNGYKDNYYLQMINYIRQFKGLEAPPVPTQKTINISGGFEQWKEVTPEYKDFTGDTINRSHDGYGNVRYTNKTGRNDFETLKVTRDKRHIYFYAKTVNSITFYHDRNWMMLFLRVNEEGKNTWYGYDYLINRKVIDHETTTLEKSLGGWLWEEVSTIPYRVTENELHLSIPLEDLGLSGGEKSISIQFKWSDNMQVNGDPMDFYINGDVAPDGRLNFMYQD